MDETERPAGRRADPLWRALTKRSVVAFDELRLGVKDLEFLADPKAGQVRIASPIGTAAGFVGDVIDRFARRHPRVVCHVLIGGHDTICRALEERDVDVAITVITAPFAENHLQAEVLCTGSRFVVAGIENPWARRRRVELADLMNEPWTLPPSNSLGGAFANGDFRAAGLDVPRAAVIIPEAVARLALVARGRFLTIAAESAFVGWDSALKTLPIELAAASYSLGIITLKNRTPAPVAQLFIACAREVAKPLAAGKSISARRRL
jgi:DNA-binding transcriptional LysR family regulator